MKRLTQAAVIIVSSLMGPAIILAQNEAMVPQQDIYFFVQKEYLQGIPCAQAKAYGNESVYQLVSMLEDPLYEKYWENIVASLGCIGDPAAVSSLENFLKTHQGEISFDAFKALQGVPTALGFISKEGDEHALDLLTEIADEKYWKDAQLRILGNIVVNDTVIKKNLMRSTVVALSYSDHARALGKLKDLQDDPFLDEDIRDAVTYAVRQ